MDAFFLRVYGKQQHVNDCCLVENCFESSIEPTPQFPEIHANWRKFFCKDHYDLLLDAKKSLKSTACTNCRNKTRKNQICRRCTSYISNALNFCEFLRDDLTPIQIQQRIRSILEQNQSLFHSTAYGYFGQCHSIPSRHSNHTSKCPGCVMTILFVSKGSFNCNLAENLFINESYNDNASKMILNNRLGGGYQFDYSEDEIRAIYFLSYITGIYPSNNATTRVFDKSNSNRHKIEDIALKIVGNFIKMYEKLISKKPFQIGVTSNIHGGMSKYNSDPKYEKINLKKFMETVLYSLSSKEFSELDSRLLESRVLYHLQISSIPNYVHNSMGGGNGCIAQKIPDEYHVYFRYLKERSEIIHQTTPQNVEYNLFENVRRYEYVCDKNNLKLKRHNSMVKHKCACGGLYMNSSNFRQHLCNEHYLPCLKGRCILVASTNRDYLRHEKKC